MKVELDLYNYLIMEQKQIYMQQVLIHQDLLKTLIEII